MSALIDLTGQRFGRLLVIRRAKKKNKCRHTAFLCRCDCGAEKIIFGTNLRTKSTQSCGCLQRDILKTETRENNRNWNPDTTNPHTGRNRARARYKQKRPCVVCNSPQTERHHRDGNTFNNEQGNVPFLCRRCHMIEDGRMKIPGGKLMTLVLRTWAYNQQHAHALSPGNIGTISRSL